MATGTADQPPLGSTWDEIDAEGRQFLIHGKKHIAFDTFNKATETPGCGWPAFAHRADCKLRLLDFPGALSDAVQALDMHAKEQRDQRPQSPLPPPMGPLGTAGDALWREAELEEALVLASRLSCRRQKPESGLLIGDERGQRVEGLKADISNALAAPVSRVIRRDLIRAMMRHKGINPKRLTAGRRLSWVTVSSIQADPPPTKTTHDGESQAAAVDTPLPLPIIWGALPWTGQASETDTDTDTEDDEDQEEGEEEEQGEGRKPASGDQGVEGAPEAAEVMETGEETAEAAKAEPERPAETETEAEKPQETEEGGAAETEQEKTPAAAPEGKEAGRKLKGAADGAEGPGPRWGWLRQIPGHDHICADPVVAAQADRIAELRVLGLLERDRAYLRWLLGEMYSVQERPGERREDCGCPPCPGPNLTKWKDSELRAEEMDEKQDPLALSKWEAQDLCRKTVDELNHMVGAELRFKPRYLHVPPASHRGASPQMRAARSALRRERTLSTVRFMMRRLHGTLGAKQYRDVEQVGERLTAFLEKLPCSIFPDRLDALARTLDCRAVAARRRNNSKLAIDIQKRRCALAVNHGMSALYARALDEVALLLFSVADYQLADTSWNERLARLQQQQQQQQPEGAAEVLEEKAQVVFQLARCCFVQGYLRMAGGKGSKQAEQATKKDHRSDVPEFTMSLGRPSSSDLGTMAVKRSQSSAETEEAPPEEVEEEMYEPEWITKRGWTPELLGYDLGSVGGESEIQMDISNVELKPNSLEGCLRILMAELGTKDPLNEYAHLVAVQRYPDVGDAARTYPLMPPDFDLDDNIMNKEYEVFENRFRDACHFFVCTITGVSPFPEAAAEAAEPGGPDAEGVGKPAPTPASAADSETERLPSVTEEPEEDLPQPPPSGTGN